MHVNARNMAWLKHIPVCMKCALTLKGNCDKMWMAYYLPFRIKCWTFWE